MEFTETYKQTGPCCFSPNARFIAVAVDYRLVIRDTLSFKVIYAFIFHVGLLCLYEIRLPGKKMPEFQLDVLS